jgi:hypothetical protein
MLYGNSSNGYSYSPDCRNDRVDHYNSKSQFIGANGSRQGGYHYSPANNYKISVNSIYESYGRNW